MLGSVFVLSLGTHPELCAGEFQLGRADFAEQWDGASHSAAHGDLGVSTG